MAGSGSVITALILAMRQQRRPAATLRALAPEIAKMFGPAPRAQDIPDYGQRPKLT